ncbi:glycerophosphodiester phosphodiesterase family protein [Phragmitibacter flavus]|uniref:Glycerophosphodiester phosphodiesterase family protein n=1 Tax=Phragmitibacter flavus TaxID=2576071 RepID=A0A5R8KC73_9BACT|nr:glycerophosphodiester phosphodiesterase family protein [Phragmitibacter flavus]TLD69914.1 glycerophosphodiester phosphodiesterase family protein [Phragmitibacter flavus]
MITRLLCCLLLTSAHATEPVPFIVQSHRGAGVLAPENSVKAFELGWELGAIPEADIRTTSDGHIVVFHDKNFARVVHDPSPELKKQGVRDLPLSAIRKLKIGAETGDPNRTEHIHTLDEIFDFMRGEPHRRLYLDIKEVDLKDLANLVKKQQVGSQVIFASTIIDEIRAWKALLPDAQTLHWMGGKEEKLRTRIDQLKTENFGGITQLQIHIREPKDANGMRTLQPSEAFIRELAAELKPRGILFQALPWAASEPAIYERLLNLGVQSFATDHPDVVIPIMRRHQTTTTTTTTTSPSP